MQTYRKLLFIIWMFVAGCVAGGFDITQPLITLVPEPAEEPVERVRWIDYDQKVGDFPKIADKCIFFYFKTQLSCWECNVLDEGFKDKRVIFLLNYHFINHKITDDMEGFDRGLGIMGIKRIPHILIIRTDPLEVLVSHSGVVNTNGLINIINSTSDRCY